MIIKNRIPSKHRKPGFLTFVYIFKCTPRRNDLLMISLQYLITISGKSPLTRVWRGLIFAERVNPPRDWARISKFFRSFWKLLRHSRSVRSRLSDSKVCNSSSSGKLNARKSMLWNIHTFFDKMCFTYRSVWYFW